MGSKISKIAKGVFRIVDGFLEIANDAKEIRLNLDRNLDVMERNFDKNFDGIKNNLDAINRNYDAIREVGSKVDRNFNEMVTRFEQTAKTLELMEKNLKNEFNWLREYVKASKIETVTSEITFIIEQLINKKILIQDLNDDELINFLESSNGLSWLESSKETLHKAIYIISENYIDWILPKNSDDEISFKTSQVLLMGLKAYFEINFDLVNAYKHMADHHYQLNQIDTFNNFIITLSSTIKDFEIVLIGVKGKMGMIEKVKTIFDEVKKIDFIQQERKDVVTFLTKRENEIEKMNLEFNELKKLVSFIENKPSFEIDFDFNQSNVKTPFGNWIDGSSLSYAIQYVNGSDFSLISDWSTPYELLGKACPVIKLNKYTGNVERIVFRKISNNPPELVGKLKDKNQQLFRDIEMDLFDATVGNANEELAIKRLNFLLQNGANIDADFANGKLIHFVAKQNKPKLLEELIKNNATINIGDKDGRQPIHIAVESGHIEMIQTLLDHNVDINAKTNLNWTPFHYACKIGSEEIASLLIKKGSNVTLKTENDFNAYHIANSYGKSDGVNDLLSKIPDLNINAKSNKGLTAMHLAILGEHISSLEILLNNTQIDVNAESEGQLSGLHFAAMNGNLDIIKKLLKHKDINVNQLTSDGWSALQLAILSEKEEVALELLKSQDIDVNLKGKSKLTAIHLATMKSMTKVVKSLILEKRAKIEDRDTNGSTSLHLACGSITNMNNIEILKLLVDNGKASLNVKQKNGNTPLMLCALNNQLEKCQFLVQKGARLDDQNELGLRAIDLSAYKGHLDLFKYFIEKISNDEITRLTNSVHLACYSNQPSILKIMIEKYGKSILYLNDENKGNTVFHSASGGGNLEMLKFLFENVNFDLDTLNNDGESILHSATSNFATIRYLQSKEVSLNINLNLPNKENFTPILQAAEKTEWSIVKLLLDSKLTDYKIKTKGGNSLLHYAARDNEIEMVDYLVDELKFIIDDLNIENNWAPLSYSVRNGHFLLAKHLIEEKNANYKLVDKSGLSILHLAVESGNLELIQYLVEQKGLNPISLENTTSCLHLSAKHNHLEILKYLLTKKSNIDAIDENGNTCLLLAAKSENWEIVEYLINQNANTELLDHERNSIIHEIATNNKLNLLKLLKNKKISKEKRQKNSQGMTALHNSAGGSLNSFEFTKYLVEDLGFIFDQDNLGNTPMHYSSRIGDLQTTVYFAERFNFNQKNDAEETPLSMTKSYHIAKYLIDEKNAAYKNDLFYNVRNQNLGVLKYLISDQKLDYQTTDTNGSTILIQSASHGYLPELHYLVGELQMNITQKDKFEKDAMFYAYQNGHLNATSYLVQMNNQLEIAASNYVNIFTAMENNDLEAIDYFIKYKQIDPNLRDQNYLQSSILHYASEKPDGLEIVKFLLSKGADLYAREKYGDLPLHKACQFSNDIVVFYIQEKKMDPNLKGDFDYSCLHIATNQNNIDLVKFILDAGADIKQVGADGKTALDIAVSKGFQPLADYLKSRMPQVSIDQNSNLSNSDEINLEIMKNQFEYPTKQSIAIENLRPEIDNQKSIKTTNPNIQDMDLNSSLMLFNVLVRKFTNQKFITDYERPSLMDAKISAINIVDSLEKLLSKMSEELGVEVNPNFDPTLLISNLTWHLRNGEFKKILALLISNLKQNLSEFKAGQASSEVEKQLETNLKEILIKELQQIRPRRMEASDQSKESRLSFVKRPQIHLENQFEVTRID